MEDLNIQGLMDALPDELKGAVGALVAQASGAVEPAKPLTLEEAKAITKAKAAKTVSADERADLEDTPLTIMQVMSHGIDIVDDETGELKHDTRVVFFVKEHKEAVAFTGSAAREFAALLSRVNPTGKFDGTVVFKFRTVQRTRKGRRTFNFEII